MDCRYVYVWSFITPLAIVWILLDRSRSLEAMKIIVLGAGIHIRHAIIPPPTKLGLGVYCFHHGCPSVLEFKAGGEQSKMADDEFVPLDHLEDCLSVQTS